MKKLLELSKKTNKSLEEILKVCINHDIAIFCDVDFLKPINNSIPWNRKDDGWERRISSDRVLSDIQNSLEVIGKIYPSDELLQSFFKNADCKFLFSNLNANECFAIKVNDDFIPCFVSPKTDFESEGFCDEYDEHKFSINNLYCLEDDIETITALLKTSSSPSLIKLKIDSLQTEIQFNETRTLIFFNNFPFIVDHEISLALVSALITLYQEFPCSKGFTTHQINQKKEVFLKNGVTHKIRDGIPRRQLQNLITCFKEDGETYFSFNSPIISNPYSPFRDNL